MSGICRRCGIEIDWALTLIGRRMPINPGYSPDGNVAVWTDGIGRLRARVLARGQHPEPHEHRRTPHFATCPNWKTRRTQR